MNGNPYFILFRRENRVVAGLIDLAWERPPSIHYQDRDYQWRDDYLGPFDHLVSPQADLLGFCFPYFQRECPDIASGPFVLNCANVSVTDAGVLNVNVSENSEAKREEWRSRQSGLYADGEGDVIILVSTVWMTIKRLGAQENLGEIGFPLIEHPGDLPRLGKAKPRPPRLEEPPPRLTRYFILFHREKRALAGVVTFPDEFPTSIDYQGRTYQEKGDYIGDFDHLVSHPEVASGRSEHLLGFSFPYFDIHCPEIASSPFVLNAKNVNVDDDMLIVNLSESARFDMDCAQVIGAFLYTDESGDIIIVAPAADWWLDHPEKIEFPLVQDPNLLPRCGTIERLPQTRSY